MSARDLRAGTSADQRAISHVHLNALLSAVSVAASERINSHCDGQYERRVRTIPDLHAIGLAHAKPFLGDLGDRVTIALDFVLVIDHVAFDREVLAVLHLDMKSIADTHDLLLDFGFDTPGKLDLDGVSNAQLFLANRCDFVS